MNTENKLKAVFVSGTDTGCKFISEIEKLDFLDMVLVVTGPDRQCGRGRKIKQAPVAEYCGLKEQAVFQPEDINSGSSVTRLTESGADIAVVVDYGQILAGEVLGIFGRGAYNLHYSILPDLRGPEPVRWALLKGYRETGVTLMKMDERIDTGSMISKSLITIEETDDYGILKDKLTGEAVKMLTGFLESLHSGMKTAAISQKPLENMSYAGKLDPAIYHADWSLPAEELFNRIRALSPAPACRSSISDRMIKIMSAGLCVEVEGTPGTVTEVSRNSFTVACAHGGISILRLQPEGKRVMETAEFLLGNPLEPGQKMRETGKI
ncbi:MAG: methionyl-tRNA formyltransferase [Elusimicrobiota bacterium]